MVPFHGHLSSSCSPCTVVFLVVTLLALLRQLQVADPFSSQCYSSVSLSLSCSRIMARKVEYGGNRRSVAWKMVAAGALKAAGGRVRFRSRWRRQKHIPRLFLSSAFYMHPKRVCDNFSPSLSKTLHNKLF